MSLKSIQTKNEEFPHKNSLHSLTLESEIKRIAAERVEPMERVVRKLAEMSGIGERQIYNYRTGKTDIPSSLIPVFCRQFGSNALAMAILQQCRESDEQDCFDLVRLANQSARTTLQAHDKFLEAFDDGHINGFEYNELKKASAGAIANFHRLDQIVEDAYSRRRAA